VKPLARAIELLGDDNRGMNSVCEKESQLNETQHFDRKTSTVERDVEEETGTGPDQRVLHTTAHRCLLSPIDYHLNSLRLSEPPVVVE